MGIVSIIISLTCAGYVWYKHKKLGGLASEIENIKKIVNYKK